MGVGRALRLGGRFHRKSALPVLQRGPCSLICSQLKLKWGVLKEGAGSVGATAEPRTSYQLQCGDSLR